jgi:hypothetical protein
MSQMSIELKNIVNKRKELEKLIKLYNKKLKKLNQILEFKKSIYKYEERMSEILDDNIESSMPLIYNKITERNINREKSRIITKQLINRLIKRKIKIKKENTHNESERILPLSSMSLNESVDGSSNRILDDILNIKIPNFKEKETYISDYYKYNEQEDNIDIDGIIVKEEFEIPPLEIVI